MKHKHTKLAAVLTALLFVAAAQSAYMLPKSDYWHGSQNYYNPINGIRAYVEYAVYQKDDGFPSAITLPAGTDGDYLYAYMIRNTDSTSMATVIGTFKLISGADISATAPTYADDGSGGLIPDTAVLAGKTISWGFAGGVFVYNKHSAYLIFASDYAPTIGSIELSTQFGDDAPAPGSNSGTEVPEPTTVALLSMSAFGLLRKKVRRS
jgi:hypothetical protein